MTSVSPGTILRGDARSRPTPGALLPTNELAESKIQAHTGVPNVESTSISSEISQHGAWAMLAVFSRGTVRPSGFGPFVV